MLPTSSPPDPPQPTVDDPYRRTKEHYVEPPRTLWQSLKHLGPGMILIGSVVGSGELIMTTKLGAETGFVLLWFVLFSCLIKVVVQGELARFTISSGETFLESFNRLPGPRLRRPSWLDVPWMLVVLVSSVVALGIYSAIDGPAPWQSRVIVGVTLGLWVIAALCFSCRIRLRQVTTSQQRQPTAEMADHDRPEGGEPSVSVEQKGAERPVINWVICIWLVTVLVMFINGGAILGAAGQALALAFPDVAMPKGTTGWAFVVAAVSAIILVTGSYRLLEGISVALVASFTFLTIFCTFLLQRTGYAITPEQLQAGLIFDLPGNIDSAVVMTGLAMYAGTGIGANEMMSYTYWCVEKGYARNAGQRQPDPEWAHRARGWIRVMYTDVYLTLIVYTVSTICFFFLGAAVLHAQGLNPEGAATVDVLGGIYTKTLGNWAATMFVVGAFFVLFSTVLSGVAGATRAMADGLCVMGIIDARDPKARFRLMRIFAVVALTTHAVTYSMFENPPLMLMISSLVAVVLYPIVGVGTIYFRYRGVDQRIAPGRVNSSLLWICGLFVIVVPPLVAIFSLALKNGWISLS